MLPPEQAQTSGVPSHYFPSSSRSPDIFCKEIRRTWTTQGHRDMIKVYALKSAFATVPASGAFLFTAQESRDYGDDWE
jgi:hypothetical protein